MLSVVSVEIFYCFVFAVVFAVSTEKIKFPDKLDYPQGVAGDEDDPSNTTDYIDSSDEMTIPLDLARKLNTINNMDELYRTFSMPQRKIVSAGFGSSLYGLVSKLKSSSLISGRTGGAIESSSEANSPTRGGSIERNAAVLQPQFAHCEPELRAVKIYKSTDRRIIPMPMCTRIERCGGCCQHERLSCQAVEEEIVNFEVNLLRYEGGGLKQVGTEIVPVKRHIKCDYRCKVKKSHCTEMQEYREKECRCVCKNVDSKEKCRQESDVKLWDSQTCSCNCRAITECSSGYFFSNLTCSCEQIHSTQVQLASDNRDRYDYNYYKLVQNNQERLT